MKRTLQGRQYDTEKATAIAVWNEGYSAGSRMFCEETIYRTRSGLYFLHGRGGADSKYASTGRGIPPCYGEAIVPLTYEAAAAWAAEHPARVDYNIMAVRRLQGLPGPERSLKVSTLIIKIPAPMKELVQAEASRRKVSVTTIVLELIADAFA